MLVQNGVTFESDVAQKMARFLVTQAFNAFFLDQPIAALQIVFEAFKLFTQLQIAMFLQKLARGDDVTGARARITMNAGKRVRQVPRSCRFAAAGARLRLSASPSAPNSRR